MAQRAPLRPEALAWPRVGREAELERIAAARTTGAGPGVVIGAEAGVGKSRLARHAVEAAERDGATVGWVQATRSAASVPLGAFAGLIPAGVRADDPLELMRRSVDDLRVRAAGRPIVLGVDDAQLLDATSSALTLHLAVTGTAFVVATVRPGEPCPDAIRSLWKDAGAPRMDLTPLGETDTGTLIEAVLGGPVEHRLRGWVFDSSRGNVLYVRELLLAALSAGALQETGGFWRLARRPPPSPTLSDLISARLAGLGDDERRAVELLALGEPLRLAEVVEVAGTDTTASVESRGLVAVHGAGGDADMRLAHPLYGEVVRTSMPVTRARELRRRLAALVRARERGTPDDTLRVARWLLDAGDEIPAHLLVEAAGAANLAGDPELGGRLAGLALDGGAGVEAAVLLARAHAIVNRFDDAEAVFAAAEADVDEEVAIDYLQQRVTVLFWGLQRADDAHALLARAQGWWPGREWRLRLDPLRVYLTSLTDGFGGAVAITAEILADEQLDPEVRRRMEATHVANLFYSGRALEAYDRVRSGRPPVPARDEFDELAVAMWTVIGIESGCDFEELRTTMAAIFREGVRAGDHASAGMAALTLGALEFLAGRHTDATRWLAESEVHSSGAIRTRRSPCRTRCRWASRS